MNDSKKNPDVEDVKLDKKILKAMSRGEIEKCCRQYHIPLDVAVERARLMLKRPMDYRLKVYLLLDK